jgi:phage tail tube protein FII
MDVYTLELANLFCGDHDPENSKHLVLSELKLPAFQEAYTDHNAGGARIGIEVFVGIQKPVATFKLLGWDFDLMAQFGNNSRLMKTYTAYGVLREKSSGIAREAKAIMRGRLGQVESEAWTKGEAQSTDYGINEILHYELYFNGAEKFYWDFLSSTFRVNSIDPDPDINRILRING